MTHHLLVRIARNAARACASTALLLLALTVAIAPLSAQPASTGEIRGRVYNGGTNANLESAMVTVAGTDLSALTERDGTFVLSGVPAGTATLRVTYPGLDDATAPVGVAAGGSASRDFKLSSGVYVLEAVSVSALREGNAAAIARQETALTVGNTVSTDAYGNIAKGDMGSFLQRLPGVVGEYGGSAVDAISVRGLSPEFTSVMMDGTRTASANPDSRSQLVSGLAAGAIESVEVIKTPTADMDADSLGGVVNLRTRSGFDRSSRTLVLNAATSYNETMGKHLDPSGSGRQFFPNYSLDYSDVFTLFGRKLGVSITGGYQEVGDGLQTIRTTFAANWNYAAPTAPRQVLYADQEYHLNKRVHFQAKFDYKLSPDSSLTFSAGWTRFVNIMDQNRPQYTDNLTVDLANSNSDFWVFTRSSYRSQRDIRDTPSDTWNFLLGGKTAIGAVKLAWTLTYSDSFRPLDRMSATARSNNTYGFTYDRRTSKEFPTLTFNGPLAPPNDPFTNMLSIAVTGTHENASDEIASAKLDASRDFARWPIPVKLKAGFRVRQQDRDRDADSITGTLGAGDYSRYREFNFRHGWIDGRYPATPIINTKAVFKDIGFSYLPSGLAARPAVQFAYNASALPLTNANLDTSVTNSLQNDYETRETIPAGYVQGEVKLLRNLQMTAGLRFEQTLATITSRFENTRATTPEARFGTFKTIESDYVDWFPNLQFRYEPIPHLTVRANYSTTIGRPRISDLVGRFSINDLGQNVTFSNPSLKPQISSNYDVSVEYYFKPVGVVSVGAFRKDIKNYVTATSFRITGNEFGLDLSDYVGWQGNSRVNAGDGTVEGMEFNYSQQLSFLPGLLRGFGVMGNWTVLTSAGDYNGVVTNLPFKNNLTGMRPRSGNAGVTYNYGRWDVRLMWNFSDTYLSSLNAGDPSSSEFIGRRGQFDFFARVRLTRQLNVFLDVINLTEENRGRYSGLYRDDRWAQTNLFPRSISAGFQARF
ncbi:TonB-dependent receptor [Horticoccus sp. 23ND18S-11]|uniref:TonB-dependent receptor n=1 Tax=Horticoccus sp. 23ND18S-11 TaxID=3391832 RepID=UPI0039C94683